MIAGLDPATAIALVIGLMVAMTMVLVVVAVQAAGSRRYTRRLQEVTLRKTLPARGGAVRAGRFCRNNPPHRAFPRNGFACLRADGHIAAEKG